MRADPKAGVGFLNDIRRMNVALTRAKFACYVIGSRSTLRSSKPWAALLDHSRAKRCIVDVENPSCNLLTLRPMEEQQQSIPNNNWHQRAAPMGQPPHGGWPPIEQQQHSAPLMGPPHPGGWHPRDQGPPPPGVPQGHFSDRWSPPIANGMHLWYWCNWNGH